MGRIRVGGVTHQPEAQAKKSCSSLALQARVKTFLVGLTVGATLLFACDSTFAVVIYKKGSNKPIAGHLVRQNGNEVVIREESSTGTRDVIVPRSEIEDLIETVSPQRLAALDPARPKEYQEYAEELAEKKLDPEARLMAIRLFQIAAWLDPAQTGHGALLGLVSLALPGEEEARYRAAAYLFDPRHHRDLLGQTSAPASRAAKEADPALGLLEALRQLRRGHDAQARAALAPPAVTEELAAYPAILTREEFLAASAAKELSSEQLRKVLELELTLDSRLHGGGDKPTETTLASWNETVRVGNLPVIPALQFDKLTAFDPRESVFRQGKWQRPAGSK